MLIRNLLFYLVKPVIPRRAQILLRRFIAPIIKKNNAHVWPINEKAATPPAGWKGWPESKQFALVIQHDVDTLKGYDNCRKLMDLEEKLGVRSCYNIVPERYAISNRLLDEIKQRGFGLGVHGLKHDGKLFLSYNKFRKNAARINAYLRLWNVHGFSSPSMHHKLEWMHHLDISYSISTFDTDPFEPQPDSVQTIFPFAVTDAAGKIHFVELPYTLPQDFTLFVILQEKTIDIWKMKLDWIAQHGGMALLNVHPDYINFDKQKCGFQEYPASYYTEFIQYVKSRHKDRFWLARPEEIADYLRKDVP